MIESLKGIVGSKTPDLLLQVGAIALSLEISDRTRAALPEPGEEVLVYAELKVREERIDLLGFVSRDERSIYRILTGISGVGKKLALAILSEMSVGDLAQVVAKENIKALTGISGVGKKTASRLLLELGSKLDEFRPDLEEITTSLPVTGNDPRQEEAIAALAALGMQRPAALRALEQAPDGELEVAELIRFALSGGVSKR
jgi:holliday junction DNA helicase RuvA